MEELKNFWKERYIGFFWFCAIPLTQAGISRATIEEDYAKKLARLGKLVLGRDEIGYVHKLSIYFNVGACALCLCNATPGLFFPS
jgi:hypothetical protein